ncbi:ubiquitin-like 1-activating enzyme E1 B [Nematocida sp. AWRm78]|nr:ubiquitin-like 1-activating enzyme E1 B [Nematocida sp. AWRm79]KAI5182556.1 ubiquitin-like 1-activating enzyme E1 B [Nematocida sp. AWRm78]
MTNSILLIGAGGIGSEVVNLLIKHYKGDLCIIDYDKIELSNLNRQYFYNNSDINKYKAEVLSDRISKYTKNIKISYYIDDIKYKKFNVDFFKNFQLIISCVDNISTRKHISMMGILSNTVIIESGSSGYDGEVYVIHNKHTECYECRSITEVKTYPICTLRQIPKEWHNCVHWAKYDIIDRLENNEHSVISNDESAEHNEHSVISNDESDKSAEHSTHNVISDSTSDGDKNAEHSTHDVISNDSDDDSAEHSTHSVISDSTDSYKSAEHSTHNVISDSTSDGEIEYNEHSVISDTSDSTSDGIEYIANDVISTDQSAEHITHDVISTDINRLNITNSVISNTYDTLCNNIKHINHSVISNTYDTFDNTVSINTLNMIHNVFNININTLCNISYTNMIKLVHLLSEYKANQYNITVPDINMTKSILDNTIPSIITTNTIIANIIILMIQCVRNNIYNNVYYINNNIRRVKGIKYNDNCSICSAHKYIINIKHNYTLYNILCVISISITKYTIILKDTYLLYDNEYKDNLNIQISSLNISKGSIIKVINKSIRSIIYINDIV